MLRPGAEEGSPFADADVRRVRLADACVRAGLPPEGLARAIGAGKLSFDFRDLPRYEWTGARYSGRTYSEAA